MGHRRRATGKVLTAKRWPALLQASAELDSDGTAWSSRCRTRATWGSGDAATDKALSAWLDHDVRLVHADAVAGTPYELTMDPADDDSEPWDFATPAGSFVDLAAVHVADHRQPRSDRRRTSRGPMGRAPLPPDGPGRHRDATGFVEDGWVGTQVRLGGAVIEVFMPTPRCAMPGRAQPAHGLVRDLTITTTVRDHHENNLGIYATVAVAGPVELGDPVGRA